MKRVVGSFFITLILYIILFSLFFIDLKKPRNYSKKSIHTLSLSNLHLIKPTPNKPKPKPKTLKPKTLPKPKHKTKKVKKKKILKTRKKAKKIYKIAHETNTTRRNVNKIAKTKKILKPNTKHVKRTQPSPPSLASLFMASKPKKAKIDDLPVQYRKLYKDEYNSFTKAQKEFLRSNLSLIGKITQKYLYLRGYPYIAVKTGQQGRNAVEFYLHPNGDISGLRLIHSSGYEALDQNSIETIKVAFKDYPRPKETTKIKIYVEYRLVH